MSLNDRLNRQRFQDANRNLSEITDEDLEPIPNLEQVNSIIEMAPPEQRIDTQLLKLYLDTIPPFDGNSLVLHSYIESVRSTFLNFPDDPHHVTHNLVLQAVKNKLKGRAQTLIASRSDLTTWTGIERLLKLTFGDQRDLQYLTHQLTSLRPNKNERPYEFGLRLQELRAVILSKINDEFPEEQVRDLQIVNYNNIAKTMFITNLPINVQTIVRIKNPDSLEDALNFVLEEEEFQNFARLHQSSQKPQATPLRTMPTYRNPNPTFGSIQNRNNHFGQNFNQNVNYTQRTFTPPQFSNNFQSQSQFSNNFQSQPRFSSNFQSQPQFPSQPINVQPRQVKQNFPTNRQTFGPSTQQNVWKPNPNQVRNLPKPTPMSGISYNNQPKPKPMSGISYMHNTETTDHVPPYQNEQYQYDHEYENQRYEDLSFLQAYNEENHEPLDFNPNMATFTQEQEQEQEQGDPMVSNFMNTEPTPYPT